MQIKIELMLFPTIPHTGIKSCVIMNHNQIDFLFNLLKIEDWISVVHSSPEQAEKQERRVHVDFCIVASVRYLMMTSENSSFSRAGLKINCNGS